MELNTLWGSSEKTFIIAEIGQNHQGDLSTAKQLIKTAKECGADCAKFQKTDFHGKFNKEALDRPYTSSHSFGLTYGEHKAFLEFSENEFRALQEYAEDIGILFTASAMDTQSLDFLVNINVPFVKLGSGDANNFLLIENAARKNVPLVISTGMQSFNTVKEIYNLVSKYHKKFAILHCVSSYPAPFEDINLNVINLYKSQFSDIFIGYSGHELGTHISTAAVALGCNIIERHLTLDKNQKGSDHKCSLEPREFQELVFNIRTLEKAMGQPIKILRQSERPCYEKLGKTLVYAKPLKKGSKLDFHDLLTKVAEPKGIDGAEIWNTAGRLLSRDVFKDESVLPEHFM
ncbi:hypothetical protein JTB14_025447 [Gonioctena quinquepunctata]|nr:hypothetical protein JTB14_025447 [Gonioctena quinquepunctata]